MNIIKKVGLLIALVIASSLYSQLAYSETGLRNFDGMSKSIGMIDHKKNIIKLAETEFTYDENTVIKNHKGVKVSEDALKKGARVVIGLNTKQRYISRPMLRFIQLESGD